MIKYIMLLALPFLASSCSAAHDAAYYSLHPPALQEALEQCPGQHPAGVTCEELNSCAIRANQLVSELQQDPQVFGQTILTLQEELEKSKSDLQNSSDKADLQAAIDKHNAQLNERLAIVKWLESPRG